MTSPERRQACLDHSEKIGGLTSLVGTLTGTVNDMKESLDNYMVEETKKHVYIEANTKFRIKHEPMLDGIDLTRTIGRWVVKVTLGICGFIIVLTGAIVGAMKAGWIKLG